MPKMVLSGDTDQSLQTTTTVLKIVPGTEILYDDDDSDVIATHLHTLQHAKRGDARILLVPQPSLTDPNDPLRWSRWKKFYTFLNALAFAFLGAITGPIMAAGMIQQAEYFHTTLTRMSYAAGATLVCQGVGTVLWMPFAIKYGRRPVYLLSNLLMMIACIWIGLATTTNYTSLCVGRAFLGLFGAPIESLAPSTATDMFFLHQRGEMISWYGLSVLGGNELGPMLSAFIIQWNGMRWAFFIVAIFIGFLEVTMFFFMPETKFNGQRPSILLPEFVDKDKLVIPHLANNPVRVRNDNEERVVQSPRLSSELQPVRAQIYLESLAFWGKNDHSVNLLSAFLRPFVLFTYPTIVWACLIYGLALSWNVILGVTVGQLFAPPPYLFSASAQGLVFLSPLVGSLIGTYLCGPVSDQIANFFTKRRQGIREPEMRLPTCAIAAVLTIFGAVMASVSYQHHCHWAVPVVGYGILSAGAQMGATLAMSYALDCHKELSVELMVSVSLLKCFIAWIWTWVVNDWIAGDGLVTVFMSVLAINTAAYLTTIGLYYRGKLIRTWIHNTDLLRRAGLA